MTEKLKYVNAEELAEFIKNMESNTFIGIAARYNKILDENNGIIDYETEGWWNIAKLCYADTQTLLFNYYGGGYPYAYSIDELYKDENIKNAINCFFSNCPDFSLEGTYLIDTNEKSIAGEFPF